MSAARAWMVKLLYSSRTVPQSLTRCVNDFHVSLLPQCTLKRYYSSAEHSGGTGRSSRLYQENSGAIHNRNAAIIHSTNQNESDTSVQTSYENNNDYYPDALEKGIGRTQSEQQNKFLLEPDQPPNAKILRFAIIGVPNSGKSTLTNGLMNWKISPVSSKVHTTRRNTLGVLTDDNIQIVFVDTPGLVTSKSCSKHNLERNMMTDSSNCIQAVDMIGILVDVSNKWACQELSQSVLELLYTNSHVPAILILNKVDLLKKKGSLLEISRMLTEGCVGETKADFITKKPFKKREKLDDVLSRYGVEPKMEHELTLAAAAATTTYTKGNSTNLEPSVDTPKEESPSKTVTLENWQDYHKRIQLLRSKFKDKKGWPHFKNVFMISALSRDGVDDLKDYLLDSAVSGNWEFHSSFITDQDPISLAKSLLWEKLLEMLPQEVPYNVKIEPEVWDMNDETLSMVFNVVCKKTKHLHMIIGSKGHKIKALGRATNQAMMDAFRTNVSLKIIVKLHREK